MTKWQTITGVILQGHQVASGQAKDSPYEKGTIEMQTPLFQKLGLDLSGFFSGTLNISIYPYHFALKKPEYTFDNLQWHPSYPPETFSFSPCEVIYAKTTYSSLIYYPHPETKIGHFQDPHTVEVLAPFIPNLNYNDSVSLKVNPQQTILTSNGDKSISHPSKE